MRVAALFASGVFAVYDLDQQGELWATHITGTAAAARIGRVTDVEWLQLPSPVGALAAGQIAALCLCREARAACTGASRCSLPLCGKPPVLPCLALPRLCCMNHCCTCRLRPESDALVLPTRFDCHHTCGFAVLLTCPAGGGAVLAASLEDGSLGLFDTVHTADVRPRRNRMTRYRALLHTPPPAAASAAADGSASPTSMPWGLASGPPVAAPPLLPRAWVLLLRLLLQRGLPEACFRELGALAASVSRSGGPGGMAGPAEVAGGTVVDTEMALERLEDEVSCTTSLLAGPSPGPLSPAAASTLCAALACCLGGGLRCPNHALAKHISAVHAFKSGARQAAAVVAPSQSVGI